MNNIARVKGELNVVIGPKGKGARFAANSLKNRFSEKISEKLCGKGPGR